MGNRTITTVAGVHGQRMVPEFLINFLESIYPYKRPVNYGKRLLREDLLLRAMKLYKLAGKKPKAVFGRRMIPNYLAKFLEDNHFAEIDDISMDYIKELSGIAYPYANVLKIGGMSYKCYQLFNSEIEMGVLRNTDGSPVGSTQRIRTKYFTQLQAGTYTISWSPYLNIIVYVYDLNEEYILEESIIEWTNAITNYTFTLSSDRKVKFCWKFADNRTMEVSDISNVMLNVVITALPYQPYFEGIRDSAVTSIVSKDSNNNVIDTFNLPAEVQALSDYGVGVSDSVNNVVDLVAKTYQRKSYSVILNGSEDGWNFGSVADSDFESGYFYYATYTGLASFTAKPKIQNSTNIVFANSTINALNSGRVANTFYISNSGNLQINAPNNNTITNKADFLTWLASNPLIIRCDLATYDEPIDISSYITTNEIEIANGGTLTFENAYEQEVPNEIKYIVRF